MFPEPAQEPFQKWNLSLLVVPGFPGRCALSQGICRKLFFRRIPLKFALRVLSCSASGQEMEEGMSQGCRALPSVWARCKPAGQSQPGD